MKNKKLISLIEITIQKNIEPILLKLQKKTSEDKILSRSEAMDLLKISSTKMYHLCRSGKISFSRIGRQLRFLESDIMEMLSQKGKK